MFFLQKPLALAHISKNRIQLLLDDMHVGFKKKKKKEGRQQSFMLYRKTFHDIIFSFFFLLRIMFFQCRQSYANEQFPGLTKIYKSNM